MIRDPNLIFAAYLFTGLAFFVGWVREKDGPFQCVMVCLLWPLALIFGIGAMCRQAVAAERAQWIAEHKNERQQTSK